MSNIVPLRKFCVQKQSDGTLDLWSPARTGDWAQDNAFGRQYADEVIATMEEKGQPFLLGHIIKAMMQKKQYGGVEVGFLQQISERLMKMRVWVTTVFGGGGSWWGYGALKVATGHNCFKGVVLTLLGREHCITKFVWQVAALMP